VNDVQPCRLRKAVTILKVYIKNTDQRIRLQVDAISEHIHRVNVNHEPHFLGNRRSAARMPCKISPSDRGDPDLRSAVYRYSLLIFSNVAGVGPRMVTLLAEATYRQFNFSSKGGAFNILFPLAHD